MRLPNRKPGKYTFPTFDPNMTQTKLDALQDKLDHLKTVSLPQAIKATQLAAENGDYSENAEYQVAKNRLRGLNRTIDELTYQINHAVIIPEPTDTTTVQVGHSVTVITSGQSITFKILGSSETNPTACVISYQSPVGAALLGHKVNDVVSVQLGAKIIKYTLVSIQ